MSLNLHSYLLADRPALSLAQGWRAQAFGCQAILDRAVTGAHWDSGPG